MSPDDLLLPTLKRYWGYDSFLPLQAEIVRSLLAQKDTCVIMPTGGGKSLCYQLPAALLGKTAIVISPLIALMQDQVAQLLQMGIPTAAINSAMPRSEQTSIMREAVKRLADRSRECSCGSALKHDFHVSRSLAGGDYQEAGSHHREVQTSELKTEVI